MGKLALLWRYKSSIIKFYYALFCNKVRAILHRLTYSPGPNPKRVVVVGASFCGYTVAKQLANTLPSGYAVTVVEKTDCHNHTFVFPRFSVFDGHEDLAFIPMDKRNSTVTPKGSLEFIFDGCKEVRKERNQNILILESGTTLAYEFLVIATGSQTSGLIDLGNKSKKEGISKLKRNQELIRVAKSIAIVGAGAVGVELATDIKYLYRDSKSVVLFNSRDHILPKFPKIVSQHVEPELERLNVVVRNNARPTVSGKTLIFKDGTREDFDLVFVCTGAKSNSGPFKGILGDAIDEATGEIMVEDTLQVQNAKHPNVFALGDVMKNDGQPKMGRSAFVQSPTVVQNIVKLIKDGPNAVLSKYKPDPLETALKLTLGLDRDLNHSTDFAEVQQHKEDYTMMSEYTWRFFDVDYEMFQGHR
jgi:apoptosis-inducing factor 2